MIDPSVVEQLRSRDENEPISLLVECGVGLDGPAPSADFRAYLRDAEARFAVAKRDVTQWFLRDGAVEVVDLRYLPQLVVTAGRTQWLAWTGPESWLLSDPSVRVSSQGRAHGDESAGAWNRLP